MGMGQHSTPRGETSTYLANGGKQTFPYKGTHREGIGRVSLTGRKNRPTKETGSEYTREDDK